jgi:hypothetical protein
VHVTNCRNRRLYSHKCEADKWHTAERAGQHTPHMTRLAAATRKYAGTKRCLAGLESTKHDTATGVRQSSGVTLKPACLCQPSKTLNPEPCLPQEGEPLIRSAAPS